MIAVDVWVAGDSMLVVMGDSDADSLSEASSDASVPLPANFDDSLAAVAPPCELSEQHFAYAYDAKEKSETADRYVCSLSQTLCTPRVFSPAKKIAFVRRFAGFSVNAITRYFEEKGRVLAVYLSAMCSRTASPRPWPKPGHFEANTANICPRGVLEFEASPRRPHPIYPPKII